MAGDEQLLAAIRKRALGYEASETVCEYDADGNLWVAQLDDRHVLLSRLLLAHGAPFPSEQS